MSTTAKDYLDAFVLNPAGQRCLNDLLTRFGGELFVPGTEGQRQTDFNLGARAVLDFIVSATDLAEHGHELPARARSTT